MEILAVVAIVLSVIAISRINDLSLKVSALEKQYKGKGMGENVATLVQSVSSQEIETDTDLENEETEDFENSEDINGVAPAAPYKESGFITWLKEDWLLKLGGTLVIMGVLFFLSLAYTEVGPVGKTMIGYIFGVTLMLFGFKYAKKNLVGGSAIHVIGALVVIITTYLARQPGYDLFDPYLATLLMFITTACVALTSYAYNRPQLAHIGLFLAGIVPVLTNTEGSNFTELLMYLLIVTLGVLWLALVTKWRTLVFLALGIVCVYSLLQISSNPYGQTISLAQSYLIVVFGVIFYITSLFSIMREKGVTQQVDGVVAFLNAGFALMWILSPTSHISREFAPMVIALISLIYATGFFFVYKVTNVYTSFVVYGGVSLGLFTTAIMLQLSGRSEAVALLLIGAGVTVFTSYLSKNEDLTKGVAIFNVLPFFYVMYSLVSIFNFSSMEDAWKDFLIVGLAIVVYYGMYRYFVNRVKDLGYVSLAVGFGITIIAFWQLLHIVIGGGFATFLSILGYVLLGLIVLFQAEQEKNDIKVKIAKNWLGLVALHVIFWDAWQTGSIGLGVLICIVVGILLLSSVFIIRKKENK